MSELNSALAHTRVTAQHPFFSCNPTGDELFSVRPGMPVFDALAQASCFMAAARDATYQAASREQSDSISGAAYLIEMAKAVLDSTINAINQEKIHG